MSGTRPVNTRAYPLTRLAQRLRPLSLLLMLAALLAPLPALALTLTSAVKDQVCAGARPSAPNLGCNAGEFTVAPTFSAEPGTPPFCTAGAEFNFKVDLEISGTNTDRYDVGFFVGQQGNSPTAITPGNICSVATFPNTPAPWEDNDADACGDFDGWGVDTIRINEIKVVCSGTATGALAIPYLLTYRQNTGTTCSGPGDVNSDSGSKCNNGTASVSGVVSVSAGAYVDITKQTLPDGNSQTFSFTATGPVGSKVGVLTGAVLTPTSASGGTYSPALLSSATNSVTFSLSDGQTARIYMDALPTARTLTIVESATPGWNSTAAISCSNVRGTPITAGNPPNNATRTITAALSQADSAAACTITNTKPPVLRVTKVTTGDVGSFTFTGTNGWTSQTLTTTTAGVGVTGATQTLTPSVATTLTESLTAGFRLASINCSGLAPGGVATPNLTARTVTLDATGMGPGADITCIFNNVRQRTLTVTKSLSPLADTGKFVMSANGTTGTEAGNGATASALVDVGSTATFGESAGTGTALANYNSSFSCNTTPATNGSGSSGSFTMPNANVACTLTNVRRSASLVLRKTWVNAINGNTASVASSGFTNNASTGTSVTTGGNTTSGTPVTVYAGEIGTFAETFTVGDSANYLPSLACTGSSGLSVFTLTVQPADTSIDCTWTNTRRSASLRLAKAWVNAKPGDTATVTSTGFGSNATSGAAVATGTNTVTGSAVTVYAAESGTISETISVGDTTQYADGLSCTGSSGLSGNTLTVAPSDTVITCTYTNTRKKPILSLLKWTTLISDPVNALASPKALPGSVRTYSLRLANSGPGQVDNNSVEVTDPLPPAMALYVNDLDGPGSGPIRFTDGSPASGLSWVFTSLDSDTDSIDFSDDNGFSWTYDPTPDADGYDPAVTTIRLRPQGTMNAAGGGNPYVDMTFRMRLK